MELHAEWRKNLSPSSKRRQLSSRSRCCACLSFCSDRSVFQGECQGCGITLMPFRAPVALRSGDCQKAGGWSSYANGASPIPLMGENQKIGSSKSLCQISINDLIPIWLCACSKSPPRYISIHTRHTDGRWPRMKDIQPTNSLSPREP